MLKAFLPTTVLTRYKKAILQRNAYLERAATLMRCVSGDMGCSSWPSTAAKIISHEE